MNKAVAYLNDIRDFALNNTHGTGKQHIEFCYEQVKQSLTDPLDEAVRLIEAEKLPDLYGDESPHNKAINKAISIIQSIKAAQEG